MLDLIYLIVPGDVCVIGGHTFDFTFENRWGMRRMSYFLSKGSFFITDVIMFCKLNGHSVTKVQSLVI